METHPNEYMWYVNPIAVDGCIDTIPGYKSRCRLPDGKAGGMIMCKDSDGTTCIIALVDDIPYILKDPFETYKKLEI